jgi:hypothetical protein
MNRFRVLIERSRSDQNRAIESHEHNANVTSRTQSRKKTEFAAAFAGYVFRAEIRRNGKWRDAVALRPVVSGTGTVALAHCVITVAGPRERASCVAKQMRLSTRYEFDEWDEFGEYSSAR